MPGYLVEAAKQWSGAWQRLSTWQKASLAVCLLLIAGGLYAVVWWRTDRDFQPLFTGMSAEDAGAVVERLKESGAEYRVAGDGGTVLVRSAKVAETRLQLAAAGLPKTGRIGFELFDKTALGTTDFAEHVNYRRALEGELERSIKSVAAVEQARVHLTFPKDSVFLESRTPAKASVLLRLKPRSSVSAENVNAIKHLVASAVEGLAPAAVSVMDVNGNLLSRGRNAQEGGENSDEYVEYRQSIERDLLAKIDATLQPLLGEGRFRAGVSVDCDFTSGEQSEEVYDPDKSVMTSSTKTEDTNTSMVQTGVPGTASNLPRPAARATGPGHTTTRRSETIAYQTSRLVKRLHLPRGTVKRISASVLLDQTVRWEGQGPKARRVLIPPSPESVRAIRELVSAAIGFNPQRGDQLVIESLPFGTTLQEPPPDAPAAPPAATEAWWTPLMDRRVGAGVAVAIVALAAWLFLWKRKRATVKRIEVAKSIGAAGEKALVDASEAPDKIAGGEKLLLADARVQGVGVEKLAAALRESIAEDPVLAASVLRSWLDEPTR